MDPKKIDEFYLEEYSKMIKKDKKRRINEDDLVTDVDVKNPPIQDDMEEPVEQSSSNYDDAVEEADEALEQIDLDGMSPDAKLELIYSIIDSHQNSVDSDEEFSEFMEKLEDVMNEFSISNEDEEETGEEMGGEEEAPAEANEAPEDEEEPAEAV